MVPHLSYRPRRSSALFVTGLFCSLLIPSLSAQPNADSVWLSEEWYRPPASTSLFDPVQSLPEPFRAELLLKRYIRDEQFFELRKRTDDTLAVDAIFEQALLLTDSDPGRALFVTMMAVMDHEWLGIRIPLLGTVYIPLTTESDSLFRLRRTHLPKRVLADRPKAVDKDKLQHFFGSAFLMYVTRSPRIAGWFGDMVERGEASFVMGGSDDVRDREANAKGREFGRRLLKDPAVLPSDVLWGK